VGGKRLSGGGAEEGKENVRTDGGFEVAAAPEQRREEEVQRRRREKEECKQRAMREKLRLKESRRQPHAAESASAALASGAVLCPAARALCGCTRAAVSCACRCAQTGTISLLLACARAQDPVQVLETEIAALAAQLAAPGVSAVAAFALRKQVAVRRAAVLRHQRRQAEERAERQEQAAIAAAEFWQRHAGAAAPAGGEGGWDADPSGYDGADAEQEGRGERVGEGRGGSEDPRGAARDSAPREADVWGHEERKGAPGVRSAGRAGAQGAQGGWGWAGEEGVAELDGGGARAAQVPRGFRAGKASTAGLTPAALGLLWQDAVGFHSVLRARAARVLLRHWRDEAQRGSMSFPLQLRSGKGPRLDPSRPEWQ
jgi:hypothetical protein